MGIIASGEALLSSAVDGIVHPISADDLDWEITGSDDRQMGMEILHQADFEHPELGRLAWTISEYPAEFLNFVTHDMNGHLLLEDFDFSKHSITIIIMSSVMKRPNSTCWFIGLVAELTRYIRRSKQVCCARK